MLLLPLQRLARVPHFVFHFLRLLLGLEVEDGDFVEVWGGDLAEGFVGGGDEGGEMISPVFLKLRSRQGPSRERRAGHCAACLRQSGPRSETERRKKRAAPVGMTEFFRLACGVAVAR